MPIQMERSSRSQRSLVSLTMSRSDRSVKPVGKLDAKRSSSRSFRYKERSSHSLPLVVYTSRRPLSKAKHLDPISISRGATAKKSWCWRWGISASKALSILDQRVKSQVSSIWRKSLTHLAITDQKESSTNSRKRLQAQKGSQAVLPSKSAWARTLENSRRVLRCISKK